MEKNKSTKPNLIVIGGGFAGLRIYHSASCSFNIIVVDPKNYFEYVPDIA